MYRATLAQRSGRTQRSGCEWKSRKMKKVGSRRESHRPQNGAGPRKDGERARPGGESCQRSCEAAVRALQTSRIRVSPGKRREDVRLPIIDTARNANATLARDSRKRRPRGAGTRKWRWQREPSPNEAFGGEKGLSRGHFQDRKRLVGRDGHRCSREVALKGADDGANGGRSDGAQDVMCPFLHPWRIPTREEFAEDGDGRVVAKCCQGFGGQPADSAIVIFECIDEGRGSIDAFVRRQDSRAFPSNRLRIGLASPG